MARRVVLDEHGLRISRPGVDVLSASDSQLNFTSDYSCFGVQEQGVFNVNWNVSGNSGTYSGQVIFGQTYPSVPLIRIDLVQGNSVRSAGLGRHLSISRRVGQRISIPGGGFAYGTVAHWALWTETEADRLRIRGEWSRNSHQYLIPSLSLRWTLFTYNT